MILIARNIALSNTFVLITLLWMLCKKNELLTEARLDEFCSETKCRADFGNLGNSMSRPVIQYRNMIFDDIYSVYDSCWTVNDITHSENLCADGYEARIIDDNGDFNAAALYNVSDNSYQNNINNLTYFTCCKPDYEGEVKRQCNSNVCSGYETKCWALSGLPMSCEDDDFRYPNIVMDSYENKRAKNGVIFNCCKNDDGSFENFDPPCVFTACADYGKNCNVEVGFTATPEPAVCEDHNEKGYRYPNFELNGGNWFSYSCCKTDDSSLSDLSSGGYLRDTKFYLGIVPQLIISIVNVILLVVLIISILSCQETRSESYNLYIVFLAINDLVLNIAQSTVSSIIINDSHTIDSVNYAIPLLSGLCISMNILMNTIIAYEILKLVMHSNRRMRSKPPSLVKVVTQCLSVYVLIIVLGILWYNEKLLGYFVFGGEGSTIWMFWSLFLFWIISCMIIPFVYLVYATYKFHKTGMLSLTGRTRTLTIYFNRIIVTFIVFMIPSTLIAIVGLIIPKIWIPAIAQYFATLQGSVSGLVSFMKPDIRKSCMSLGSSFKKILISPRNLRTTEVVTATSANIEKKEKTKECTTYSKGEQSTKGLIDEDINDDEELHDTSIKE